MRFSFGLSFSFVVALSVFISSAKAVDPVATEAETETKTQTQSQMVPGSKPPVKKVNEPSLTSEGSKMAHQFKDLLSNAGDRRADSSVAIMLAYSPVDLIIPSKIGASIGYVHSRESTFDAEYLGASLHAPSFLKDIGSIDDRRVSLIVRQYRERNSFHFHYGLSYFDTGIHVGSAFLQSATGLPTYSDLMRAQQLGVIFGFGNRWVLPHGVSFGVDWFSWAQPLVTLQSDSSIINYVQDSSAKQTLQDAYQLALFLPRLTLLKLEIGATF